MHILSIIIVIILLFLSAIFSGLNLGIMSLDVQTLKRKAKLGNKDALRVLPIRKNGNLLLCTLLLGNVAVNATIAVMLSSITAGVIAGFVSTALIVVFGEILPQAAYARHALHLAGKTYWLIYPFLVILYPIAKPVSMLLDKALGQTITSAYSRREFLMLIKQQKDLSKTEDEEEKYEMLEKSMMISDKKVIDVMTPKSKTYFVNTNEILDTEKLQEIQRTGHSRFPVYDAEKRKITGILFTKDLVLIEPEKERKIKNVMREGVEHVWYSEKLDELLPKFKQKKMHMFIVLNEDKEFIGIITLEDVLEEMIGDILDEYDTAEDRKEHDEDE